MMNQVKTVPAPRTKRKRQKKQRPCPDLTSFYTRQWLLWATGLSKKEPAATPAATKK